MRLKLNEALAAAPAPPPTGRGATNGAILTALRDTGRPMAPLELLAATGVGYVALRKQLSRLVRRGDIERIAPGWYVAERR